MGQLYAIVRSPSRSYSRAMNDWYVKEQGKSGQLIDIEKAARQHSEYVKCLEELGVEIVRLPAKEEFPDGCFTQDPAVVYGKAALRLNQVEPSRKGEGDEIVTGLRKRGIRVGLMDRGVADGGDVMVCEDLSQVLVGLSARTNREGLVAIRKFYQQFGFAVEAVSVSKCLHLMTGACYLGKGKFLISSLLDRSARDNMVCLAKQLVAVPDEEKYAVNVVVVGRGVVMPEGHGFTKKQIEALGYQVIETPMSEFEKADGGVTCLSLLFKL